MIDIFDMSCDNHDHISRYFVLRRQAITDEGFQEGRSRTQGAVHARANAMGVLPISIRELAEQNQAPKRFLEHIMLDLKSQGWVASVPGKNGGYRLAQAPEQIRMGQVVRYFDGLLAPINCVSVSQYEPCSQEPVCRFRPGSSWRSTWSRAGWIAPCWPLS